MEGNPTSRREQGILAVKIVGTLETVTTESKPLDAFMHRIIWSTKRVIVFERTFSKSASAKEESFECLNTTERRPTVPPQGHLRINCAPPELIVRID